MFSNNHHNPLNFRTTAECISVFKCRTDLYCGRLAASAYGLVRGILHVGSAAHQRHTLRIRGEFTHILA